MNDDVRLIQRLTDEVFIEGNLALIDELVSPDFVSHDPPAGVPGTIEGFHMIGDMVINGFTDRTMVYDDPLVATDGRVLENWLMKAVHTGEAWGLPPSNQEVEVRGIEIWRCEGGQVVEHWASLDVSDLIQKAMGAG